MSLETKKETIRAKKGLGLPNPKNTSKNNLSLVTNGWMGVGSKIAIWSTDRGLRFGDAPNWTCHIQGSQGQRIQRLVDFCIVRGYIHGFSDPERILLGGLFIAGGCTQVIMAGSPLHPLHENQS